MKTSSIGRRFIANLEAVRLEVYLDQAGLETIGVGHLLTDEDKRTGRFSNGITYEEAMELFSEDLVAYERAVDRHVIVLLTQAQFDACVSLTYNIGVTSFARSTVLKRINALEDEDLRDQWVKWNKVRSAGRLVESRGLTRRRLAEWKLFTQGDYGDV